jgi:hypothetical protein
VNAIVQLGRRAPLEQDRFGWNHFASTAKWRPKRESCSTS